MKVKEILKNVCVYLGKEELLQSAFFEDGGSELTELQSQELNKMLKCLNLVTNEIATDYLPIIKQKEVTLTGGEINVFDIDENIHEIKSIKNKFGKNLRYKYLAGKIICLATNVVVEYSIHPEEMELDGEAESFGGRLSARVLAYGVASECCYLDMIYDDASVWENRFKNALFVNSRKKGEITLKKRGWF